SRIARCSRGPLGALSLSQCPIFTAFSTHLFAYSVAVLPSTPTSEALHSLGSQTTTERTGNARGGLLDGRRSLRKSRARDRGHAERFRRGGSALRGSHGARDDPCPSATHRHLSRTGDPGRLPPIHRRAAMDARLGVVSHARPANLLLLAGLPAPVRRYRT